MASNQEKNHNTEAAENLLVTSEAAKRELSSSEGSVMEDNGRHHWGKKAEYILAAVGFCVGLGNIWRFPYVCMRNGGGAFLIPFFLSLVICALPVYFLETAMGQFNGRSCYHVWSISPLFKGIGLSMNAISFFCAWYYSIILAWTLIYLGHSFRSPLPWTRCDQPWNTPNCVMPDGKKLSSVLPMNDTTNASFNLSDLVTGNDSLVSSSMSMLTNFSVQLNETKQNATNVSSTEEFWKHKVLEQTSGLEDMGGLPWHTCLALIGANLVILVCVIKGIRSTGKVVYVTATLPYILLTIMLILGVTLPGASDGVLFYIKPDFSKLLNSQTWVDAFLQVFYSLGPGWGGLITMGSYNKFKNNCMKDSIILTLACEGTSVFGGFAIFSILGHMAHVSGNSIDSFAESGSGLAFIVYPTAISYLPLPQLWGFLFFLMLFTLGLDTQFTFIETIMTTVGDAWFQFMARYRTRITGVTMIFFTLAGLVFATRGGIYVFTLVDWYIAAFSLLPQTALECIVVGWVYGADRFCRDLELMLGRKPYYIFVLGWKFFCPGILLSVFLVTLITFKPPSYGSYTYSTAAEVFSWLYAIIPFFLLVLCTFYQVFKQKGSLIQRIKKAAQPHADWCPADPEAREKYCHELMDLSDTSIHKDPEFDNEV